ncbi:MAG: glutamine-hydrolyzing carbamoyl-phosphate synthase small subunit [Gammaproteobacteria bacterium]
MENEPALLALEDGSLFHGESIGVSGRTVGEVVFNTAITGYQEILTDPSYYQQIVTLTYPHIGNVGANEHDAESARVYVAGLVIRDLPRTGSNWRAEVSLQDYLRQNRVVAIAAIDTRRLVRILRDKGAQNGCIAAGHGIDAQAAIAAARLFPGLHGADLAKEVTTANPYQWQAESYRFHDDEKPQRAPVAERYQVVAYDYGVKHNILRLLSDRGCRITVVPAETPASRVLNAKPDGVFLSNGPGDPGACDYAIDAIREIMDAGVPTFGICLGHQLLALACGGRTVKMKFGHHGANHPVQDLATGKVMITSQNHGFTVDPERLPLALRITHRSLFDGTIQGIRHASHPAFGFQGHPEASPGPHDVRALLDHFIDLMAQR